MSKIRTNKIVSLSEWIKNCFNKLEILQYYFIINDKIQLLTLRNNLKSKFVFRGVNLRMFLKLLVDWPVRISFFTLGFQKTLYNTDWFNMGIFLLTILA